MKINYWQFKKKLEKTGKIYFNWPDLKKFYPGNKENFKVLLSHWNKKGLIYNLGRGYYAFNLAGVDYLRLANSLDKNSYVSFEYALSFHNLINQVPSVITLATKQRSRKIIMRNWTFEYTHLKDDLFFGYEFKNRIYLATPEKALADLLYLIARGKRMAELDSLELNKINQKSLRAILAKFPGYVREKAREMKMLR